MTTAGLSAAARAAAQAKASAMARVDGTILRRG